MPRIFDISHKSANGDLPVIAGGQRARTMQRLQIGLTGIALMILLVGLASIVRDRVRENDAVAVPGAAPTIEPQGQKTQVDPLVEAGIVPGILSSPSPTTGEGEGEGASPPSSDTPAAR